MLADETRNQTAVMNVMRSQLAMVEEEKTAMEALKLMVQNKTRYLPVRLLNQIQPRASLVRTEPNRV